MFCRTPATQHLTTDWSGFLSPSPSNFGMAYTSYARRIHRSQASLGTRQAQPLSHNSMQNNPSIACSTIGRGILCCKSLFAQAGAIRKPEPPPTADFLPSTRHNDCYWCFCSSTVQIDTTSFSNPSLTAHGLLALSREAVTDSVKSTIQVVLSTLALQFPPTHPCRPTALLTNIKARST